MLPSDGVARVFPAKSSTDWMSSLTTSAAPPDVVPAMIRTASPSDCAKALIAGLGPMNVMSMAPLNIASTASVPALKVAVSSATSPSSSWMKPFSTPTMAGAWVTLAK